MPIEVTTGPKVITATLSRPGQLAASVGEQPSLATTMRETTITYGRIDDVRVDGVSVVVSRVAYIDLTGKQDVISDLGQIRSNAAAGKLASDTISTYGNIVTHNVNEFATASQGAKADTAVQPAEMEAAIEAHHDDTKQDVLTAGMHIVIDEDNVVDVDGDVYDAITKKHSHQNKEVIDGINSTNISNWNSAYSKEHTHSNQVLLDSYTQTNANLADAVVQRHSHQNKNVIDGISASSVTQWNSAYIKEHDHNNKALLDTYDQTNSNISDAISKKHIHNNKTVIDGISVSDITNWNNKQSAISDLDTIRSNATAGKAAYDTIGTYGDIVTHNTAEFATSAQGTKADTAVQPAAISDMATKTWVGEQDYATETYVNNHHDSTKINVSEKGVASGVALLDASSHVIGVETVDNVTSAGSTKPLSANQGKLLADRVANLEARGRYLAIWNCATGYPTTEPTSSPYTYKSGDYFIVGTVATGSENNYRPNGSQFVIGTHSTTVETAEVAPNDYYLYDSTSWKLLKNTQKEVAFENIAGDPYDNTELAGALNAKSAVSVSNTGTSTSKVKYITIDGTEYKMADEPTEQTVKLESDLYTYVNIGKITGASQTNPVKVADAGDPLKDVFNAILGTEVDVNPTINQAGTTFTKSGQTGTTTEGGGEIGRTINAQTGTVTFTVTNTATCTYGLKAGTYDTYSKTTATTFNYPIKTRTVEVGGTSYNYQIKIEYPTLNGCTVTVTAGTLVKNDINGRILYCNVDSQNKVTISIAMPAGASTGSAQTRFNQLVADVDFNAAAYQGVTVDNFWTYLKAVYNSGKSHSAITNVKSTAYTINAGSYYTYYKVTNDTIMSSTGWTGVGSTSITDIVVVANAGQYIWFASTQNKSAIYEWNDVSGKYNADATATTKTANQTIHTATGQDVGSYYTYRTTNGRSGATNKKFKLA